MKVREAKKLAIECMQAEMNKLAVDANIVKLTGTGSPPMIKAHDRCVQLVEAIKILESLPEAML